MLKTILIALSCVTYLFAQTDPRGLIGGQITDPTGAIVAKAGVKVTNVETSVVTNGATNDQGIYEIQFLNPGTYRLEVTLSGFKQWSQGAIEVRAGERLRIDVSLQVGAMTDTVQVTAETPVLQVSRAMWAR